MVAMAVMAATLLWRQGGDTVISFEEAQKLAKERPSICLDEAVWMAGVSRKWILRRLGKEYGPPFKKRGKLYLFPTLDFWKWTQKDNIP